MLVASPWDIPSQLWHRMLKRGWGQSYQNNAERKRVADMLDGEAESDRPNTPDCTKQQRVHHRCDLRAGVNVCGRSINLGGK
jgi:Ser/Thr protein kinase RdoA (MazF antagonist)